MTFASETGHRPGGRSIGRDQRHAAAFRHSVPAADQVVSMIIETGGCEKSSDPARRHREYWRATDELSESAPSDHVWPGHHRR